MYCIELESNDPYFNLAAEEFLLKNSAGEYLLLGINSRSVIIGKHQSGFREINPQYIFENRIPVIRRISGGGTVFHDSGNLNFSFILNSEEGRQVDFRKYTKPVIDFLKSVEIDASFEGSNDLRVKGFKISGNAEHVHGTRVLHHGTLLFNSSMHDLHNSLRKDSSMYTSRAVASNPAHVINLVEITGRFSDIRELSSAMLNYFVKIKEDNSVYSLSEEEKHHTELLAESKYKTWEWNWGYGPEYTFDKSFEITGCEHHCRFFVKDGIIRQCSIKGSDQMSEISEKLSGCRHMIEDISAVFRKEEIALNRNEIFNFF